MKTNATVISVSGTRATVETARTSACEGCHKMAQGSRGCAVCTLVGGGNQRFTATAENPVGAKVGDRVTVESATGRVLMYAALVFLLPLVFCFAGWLIASRITPEPLWQAAGAAVGFVGCFAALWGYSRHLRKRRADVIITGILPPEESGRESVGQETGRD